MKDIERTVDHYKTRKELVEECREDKRRLSERKAKYEADIQQLQKNKTDLEVKYKQYMDQYKETEKLRGDIQTNKNRLEELERNRHELESDITQPITASVEELERVIQQFQSTKVRFITEAFPF